MPHYLDSQGRLWYSQLKTLRRNGVTESIVVLSVSSSISTDKVTIGALVRGHCVPFKLYEVLNEARAEVYMT